ncbi:response regulator [Chondrinema litorale]|uniref:response regulator n=1 Tax=Chondrinema litorale TaxID=2994555 RepID=UPI002542F623|nr:response regulator [Chondrinema litorale]UZR99684.1 response regulator [Chondrinema litorale]
MQNNLYKQAVVVDDFDSVRKIVSFQLENLGCKSNLAVDGEDALRYFDGRKYDLVITDLNMPKLDGISLIKMIRALPSYKFVPIILLTTESRDRIIDTAKEAGATAWIKKPFTVDSFVNTVNKLLR